MYNDVIIVPPISDVEISVQEFWMQRKPKIGDHIRVKRMGGVYAHHGIYVSDEEVIHFTGKDDDSILDWSKPEVIATDLKYFLKDGILEVKEYSDEEFQDLYSPEQIVVYARACLGDKGYNLVFNNCEHFANVCTLGRFRSHQVERVILGGLSNKKEDRDMGLFDIIGSIFGGGGDKGKRTTTTYEPDKVKIAEIESETKIRLARMEQERIDIMKKAKLDILQFETESQIALEKARTQGLTIMAHTIMQMQDKLNEVAEKRLLIIEKGSLQIIKEIENFYGELETRIQDDNEKYNTEKLPALLAILEKYEVGSAPYKIFSKKVEEDVALQLKYQMYQIENLSQRQSQIINGFLHSKERILEHTNEITVGIIKDIQNQTLALGTNKQQYIGNERNFLSGSEKLALPEGKE